MRAYRVRCDKCGCEWTDNESPDIHVARNQADMDHCGERGRIDYADHRPFITVRLT